MKIPIFQLLQVYSIKMCDENERRTPLKCSISSCDCYLGFVNVAVFWSWAFAAVPQHPKYCNLNWTINALWLRQPHYNPLFTGTTEAAVRRCSLPLSECRLCHQCTPAAAQCTVLSSRRFFFVPFQCTIPSSFSVTLPPQDRRTHLQSI